MHGLINQLTDALTECVIRALGIEPEVLEDNWDEEDEDEDYWGEKRREQT